MFVTINHIPASGAAGAALEARFAARQRLVDRLPGFRAFELLRPHSPEDAYLVVTSWISRADFENWRNSSEQRPVRPAHGGSLQAADTQSWPTMHEATGTYAPGWQQAITTAATPVVEVRVHDTDLLAEPNQATGCVSVEILRPVEGGWAGPDLPTDPPSTAIRVSRWTNIEHAGGRGHLFDILQPSYAGQ
jgi:heme-degrading monooxygenase HmoA